jgi:hypothetical protein
MMKKALKYLKKMYDRVPSGGIIDNALPEAIKELEALDKGNCENCKHLEISRQQKGVTGAYCPYFGSCKEESHLESYWEAKQ